ncbi:MAG: hypothetical protein U1D67_03160, partial [Dehalococcoidia bacterium]|nr:hypothetical protein [Dehalococcoidia bacterium]
DPPEGVECASGKGQYSTVTWQGSFSIKELESIFAKYIADYSEGEFQDPTLKHQRENMINLTSAEWNNYNGPAQKLTPKIIFNQEFGALSGLKIKYVNYAIDPKKVTRQDTQFTYTDIYGQVPPPFTEPPTIAQLVAQYGFPQPPPATSEEDWKNTWGRFWDKIPIVPNDLVWGKISAMAYGLDIEGNPMPLCAVPYLGLDIVVPEYFRTNLISAQLNQLLLPQIAQSPLAEGPSQKSLAQGDFNSGCRLPAQKSGSHSIGSCSITADLLASNKTNVTVKNPVSQSDGKVLAEVDMAHDPCQVPPDSDPGSGRKYCLPEKIPIDPPVTYEIFVCSTRSCPTCPLVPGEKTVDIPTSIVLSV